MPSFHDAFSDVLRCPVCGRHGLVAGERARHWAACGSCGEQYGSHGGIPYLVKDETLRALTGEERGQSGAQPDSESVRSANTRYHDRIAADYESDLATYDIFRPGGNCGKRIGHTLENIARRAPRGAMLLDVGCGTGNILSVAGGRFERALGVDVSAGMMSIAAGRGHRVLGADALNLPLRDASVDCVTAFSVLHHFYDYASALREMVRVLKPGGALYTDWDPNGHATHEGWAVHLGVEGLKAARLLLGAGAETPDDPVQKMAEFHHHSAEGFDAQAAARVLREAGMGRVDVVYHIDPPSLEGTVRGPRFWGMALLKVLSGISPVAENVMPFVALVARK